MNRVKCATPLVFLIIAMLTSCGANDAVQQSAYNDASLVSILVSPSNAQMVNNSNQQFIATGIYADHATRDITASVTWTTSDGGIAVVSNSIASKGLAITTSTGSITITATLGDITGSASLTVTAADTARLVWDSPMTYADGTRLLDLAGYKIYYGTSPRTYTMVINVGNVTTYEITNISSGRYYFAVTAYDASGNESDYSREIMKLIP